MRISVLAILIALASAIVLASALDVVPGLPPEAVMGAAAAALVLSLWIAVDAPRGASRLGAQTASARRELEAARTETAQLSVTAKSAQEELAKARSDLSRAGEEVTKLSSTLEGERRRAALAEDNARRADEQARRAKEAMREAGRDEAVALLGLLQQKGRFLDFVMDDVTRYPDAQVGAAARVVHQGCSSVLRDYFEISPVHAGDEGAVLTLGKDYDSHRYRLIGRVSGEPPFQGRVLHRGWLTTAVRLPERVAPVNSDSALSAASSAAQPGIIAPAEVELS